MHIITITYNFQLSVNRDRKINQQELNKNACTCTVQSNCSEYSNNLQQNKSGNILVDILYQLEFNSILEMYVSPETSGVHKSQLQ